MIRYAYWAGAVLIIVLGSWLRLADLGSAPLHFDEATGARIMSFSLEGAPYDYDPTHYHGPLLAYSGMILARIQGEDDWQSLTARGIRSTTAVAGILTLGLVLAACPLIGKAAALAAGLLIAISPVLVHFNRIFIHESLLVLTLCATGIAAAYWWRKPQLWLAVVAGVCLGLAGATRATFVLAPFTWILAALILRYRPPVMIKDLIIAAATGGAAVLVTLFFFYSGFFSRPLGLFEFISTYWQYQTTPGHDKAFGFYGWLYLMPHTHGRIRWWLGAAFILAACCFLLSGTDRRVRAARLLFLSALGQATVFSFIPYKVPWLMLMPWTQVLIAAGCVAAASASRVRSPAILLAAFAVFALSIDFAQVRRVLDPARARDTNPLQYVATVPRIDSWTERTISWLRTAEADDQVVAVVGPGHWPLPWYLRPLPNVGFWDSLPAGSEQVPLVIAMPALGDSVADMLEETHILLYEGLRTDTPVYVFIRNDVWEIAIADPQP